jgi:DNA-binding CsgD family transcriptional regulator
LSTPAASRLAPAPSIGDDCDAMGARLELRGADAESVLAFAGELAACDAEEELSAQVALLPPLAGADSVVVTDCRDWARVVRIEIGDPDVYRPELLQAVARGWREHPVLKHDLASAARGTRKLSDFVDARAWRRRGLFNDFYRPLGMTREIATQLSWGPAGSSCCVTLHRAGRDFTERDGAALALLTPHLRAARSRIAARRLLAARLALLQIGLEQAGSGALVVGRGGALVAAGTAARDLLERWFGVHSDGLPDELAEWWAAARAHRAPAGWVLARGERRLRARLVRGGDEDLILLAEHDYAALSPKRLADALPITPREAEVLARLADGRTNEGIAHDLGISRHTVIRHVEQLYARLKVGTRVAATRVALDAVRGPEDEWS